MPLKCAFTCFILKFQTSALKKQNNNINLGFKDRTLNHKKAKLLKQQKQIKLESQKLHAAAGA